jgi:hypothetical protein
MIKTEVLRQTMKKAQENRQAREGLASAVGLLVAICDTSS